jgi:hypothetical protein
VAEGQRRPVVAADLARADALGNRRHDLRTQYATPAAFQPMPAIEAADQVQCYALPPADADWRAEALVAWHRRGGYWTLVPTAVRAAAAALGLAPPVPAEDAGDAAGGPASHESDDAALRPLTSARDLSITRSGARVAEVVTLPDEATAERALAEEEELVRRQLEAVGVRVTHDPQPLKVPPLRLYGGRPTA